MVLRATGKDLATSASEKIWAPYGMEQDASWMLDRTGHEHGGGCIEATTCDFARLGQFVLDGARIDGQTVVANGWLEAATRKQVDIGQPGRGYGYQWWTVDNGTWYAFGIHGQPVKRWPRAPRSSWRSARRSIQRRRASDESGYPQAIAARIRPPAPAHKRIRRLHQQEAAE